MMSLDAPRTDGPNTDGRAWLLVLLALATAVQVFSYAAHEPWRDETQAYLLARDAPDFVWLLGALRFEGHPPLLHALFYVLAPWLPMRVCLALVGGLGSAVLLLGTVCLLRLGGGASMRQATLVGAALGSSYTFAFELGVIVRGYGGGLGLALMGLGGVLQGARSGRPAARWAWLCLAGATLTSVHAAVLAAAVITSAAVVGGRASWGRAAAVLPCTLVPLAFAVPPAERGGFVDVWPSLDAASLLPELGRLVLDSVRPGVFWGYVPASLANVAAAVGLGGGLLLLVGGAIRAAPPRPRARVLALTLLINFVLLATLMLARYRGSYRHWLFLSVPCVLGVLVEVVLGEPGGAAVRRRRVLGALALVPWALVELRAMGAAMVTEVREPFSTTIGAKGLPRQAQVVAEHDYAGTSMAAWRSDLVVRGPEARGRAVSYVRWDRARADQAPLEELVRRACDEAPERTYVFVSTLGAALQGCLEGGPLEPAAGASGAADERLALRRVHCACARGLRLPAGKREDGGP